MREWNIALIARRYEVAEKVLGRVMLSKAKHPGICKIKQMQRSFVGRRGDLLRMTFLDILSNLLRRVATSKVMILSAD